MMTAFMCISKRCHNIAYQINHYNFVSAGIMTFSRVYTIG